MISNADGLNQHAADFRKKASALGHDVGDLGIITKELASDAVGKFQENAVQYKKGIQKTISENPLVSLLVATGVGMVAGAFFNRR